MLDNIFQRFDDLAGFLFRETIQVRFSIIFFQKIPEMFLRPAGLLAQMTDEHLLPQGYGITAVPVMTSTDKIMHEPAKTNVIQVLGRPDAGGFLQNVTVLLIRKAQFPFYNMDYGKFFIIHGVSLFNWKKG